MGNKDHTCAENLTERDSLTTLNANLQLKRNQSPAVPLETPSPSQPLILSTTMGMRQEFCVSKESRPMLMGNYTQSRMEKSSKNKLLKKHSLDILPSSHSVTGNLTHHKKTELSEKDIQLINELVDVVSTSTNSSAIKIHQNGSKIIIKRDSGRDLNIQTTINENPSSEVFCALEKRNECQHMASDFVICLNTDSYKKMKTENPHKGVISSSQKI